MFNLNGGSVIKVEGSEKNGSQLGHTKETEVNFSGCKTVQSKAVKVYTEGLTDIEAKVIEKMVSELNHHPDTIHYSHGIKKLRSGFYSAKIKKGRSLKRYVKIKPHWVIV